MLQWPSGIIFIGTAVPNPNPDTVVVERLVSLQPVERAGLTEYLMIPQPLPGDLIGDDLDDCTCHVRVESLAMVCFYPADKDHPFIHQYKKFWGLAGD